MRIHFKRSISDGLFLMSYGHDHKKAWAMIEEKNEIRVGDTLFDDHCSFQLINKTILFLENMVSIPAFECRLVEGKMKCGDFSIQKERSGFSLAWITLSDKGSKGQRRDESGPQIVSTLSEHLPLCLSRGILIPDEPRQLKAALVDFCLHQEFDFVFTTGGTGVGPRDTTPEVTAALLDKRLEGFERAMTQGSLQKTAHGMISRAVAGILGQSVVVNLPGSPKAVRENLLTIVAALEHTLKKLQGDSHDCGQET